VLNPKEAHYLIGFEEQKIGFNIEIKLSFTFCPSILSPLIMKVSKTNERNANKSKENKVVEGEKTQESYVRNHLFGALV